MLVGNAYGVYIFYKDLGFERLAPSFLFEGEGREPIPCDKWLCSACNKGTPGKMLAELS